MTAYLFVEHTITDPAKFEEYRVQVGPMIAKHGGRYLTIRRQPSASREPATSARPGRDHRVPAHDGFERMV